VTPGAAPVIAANSNFRYEPASSIKVLYLLYTLRSGISMNSRITYYWPNGGPPNPDACPAAVARTPANAHTTTILTGMIQDSNNIYTRAFAIKWGLANVQALAAQLGMTSTHLDQPYIGCGFLGGVGNELTLADAARLYASVSNGHALAGAARARFFSILVGGTASASDPWGQVVAQQAASLGKSSIAAKFLAGVDVRWKAGSYAFCLSSSGCLPYKLDLALTGWISIPFMSGGRSPPGPTSSVTSSTTCRRRARTAPRRTTPSTCSRRWARGRRRALSGRPWRPGHNDVAT
jgi:Beta-lactamase enzyme family